MKVKLLEDLLNIAEELWRERLEDVKSCRSWGSDDGVVESKRAVKRISKVIVRAQRELNKVKKKGD